MKILLTLFVLFFSSSVVAEDIADFEIEGMSIGDSLLNYYNEEEILSKRTNSGYKNDKFIFFEIYSKSKNRDFKNYDSIVFGINKKDKNYIINYISAAIFYKNNVDKCYDKKSLIIKDLSILLKGAETFDSGITQHPADPSGESISETTYFFLKPEDDTANIKISCVDWSEKMPPTDHLKIVIANNQIVEWFRNEAY